MAESEDEISLKEFLLKTRGVFRYLWSKKIIILGCGLLGGLIGFSYAFYKSPIYRATTTFVLDDDKGNGGRLGSLGGLASMAGIDLGGGGEGLFQGENIFELYKSRAMIQQSLLSEVNINGKRQLLIDRYIEINELRKSWQKNKHTQGIQFSSHISSPDRTRDSLMAIIVKDINEKYLIVSRPDKSLNKIQAVVSSVDEVFSKLFDDQIVRTVNEFYLRIKTKKSKENVRLLQSKLDSVRTIVFGSIDNVAAISDATPNLNPTRQILRSGTQHSQVNIEANKAVLSQLIQNLELAKISMQKDAPLIQIIDTPIYPLEVDKVGKAKAIVLGGLVSGFFIVLILITSKFFKSILSSEQ